MLNFMSRSHQLNGSTFRAALGILFFFLAFLSDHFVESRLAPVCVGQDPSKIAVFSARVTWVSECQDGFFTSL